MEVVRRELLTQTYELFIVLFLKGNSQISNTVLYSPFSICLQKIKKKTTTTATGRGNVFFSCWVTFFLIALFLLFRLSDEVWSKRVTPICSTPQTLVAAFDLLVALCRGCVQNLKVLADILVDFYYSGNYRVVCRVLSCLNDWCLVWSVIWLVAVISKRTYRACNESELANHRS